MDAEGRRGELQVALLVVELDPNLLVSLVDAV